MLFAQLKIGSLEGQQFGAEKCVYHGDPEATCYSGRLASPPLLAMNC